MVKIIQTTGTNGMSGQITTVSTPQIAWRMIVIMPAISKKKRTIVPIARDSNLSRKTENHILGVEVSPAEICRNGANILPTSRRIEKKSAAFLRRSSNLEAVSFHPRVYHHWTILRGNISIIIQDYLKNGKGKSLGPRNRT